MNKAVLLSATAVVAVLSGGASVAAKPPAHKPYTVLWNQNSNFGSGISSQNFSSGTAYTAAADDFVIPAGQTWHVAEVDVTGVYYNGSGPASAEVVTFYTDNRKGKPGRVYRGPFTLNCTDNDGSFQCILPKRAKLPSGTWWVSVVANCSFEGCGEWNWTENTTVQGSEAMWENPGGSGKCTSWKPLHVCFGGSPADLAFDLIGTP